MSLTAVEEDQKKASDPEGEALPLDELAKYVSEQCNIEIEHNRSWPTKVMAFFLSVCFGTAGAAVALGGRVELKLLDGQKYLLILLVASLALLTILVLFRNHGNYVRYRKLQVGLQRRCFPQETRDEYELPAEWFSDSVAVFWRGVGYYVVFVALAAVATSVIIFLA